ncbi:ABC transporter substrate-binding protein [Hyphomicrobium sp. 1Nfss2.1]|uniref:ABC transporter substrate-binding protein n=1 Tax=Hyphomicrobium sp. 1Nfss2.1 TaxID=3413936 RepID=UPI003C7D38F4
MIDRRQLLLAGGSALAGLAAGAPTASAAGSLRIASLKFGTLSWLLETVRAEGLANKVGLQIIVVEVATNQAGPVALLSGNVEIIVSDWPWALRQRALGERVKFAPYSSALGAVMVAGDSPIKTIADLKDKKLGVAGGAIDKSWLLLRAYSKKELGIDIASFASPAFGSAPLLTAEAMSGRLDAVLNFWTYAARLHGEGFHSIVTMDEVLKSLGIAPVPSLVGFIWTEETEEKKAKEIAAFLSVVEDANAILAKSDAAWERLRDLVRPQSEPEFQQIKADYRAGIPQPWTGAETRSAEKLTQILVDIGGPNILGSGTQFDPKLFHAAGS